jgi:hypothetical protein
MPLKKVNKFIYQPFSILVTVQHPHLAFPIEGEEAFLPRPWWEGIGEGGTDTYFKDTNCIQ